MPAHARAPPLAGRLGGNHARTCARAPAQAPVPGSGSGSGSLPGLVLFEPGLTGMGYRGLYPLRYLDPNPNQRNGCQQTAANSWAVAV